MARYILVSDAQKGTVSITDPLSGVFRYVPDKAAERGVDSFVYRIEDPRNETKTKTAAVIVEERIMALGDSITVGLSDASAQLPVVEHRVGYRKSLYDALVVEGYRIDLVGSQQSGTGLVGFDADHEGRLDWSAEELAYGRIADGSDGIYAWLQGNPADVVLLHAGSYGLMSSANQIGAILDEIKRWEDSANGNAVTVIVARIIDQWPLNADVQAFNEALQALVEDRVSNPDNVAYPDNLIMVDQYAALAYPADLGDALHPSEAGYDKMAQIWLQTLTSKDNELLQRCP